MNQKSILIVSAQYLPHIGGVERYTDCIAQELNRRGYDVTVVTSEYPKCPEHEVKNGIKIYRLPSYRLLDGRYPVIKKSQIKTQVQSELEQKQLYHVVVNTRFYPLSLWAVRWSYKHGIPCTVIEHGTAHLQMGKMSFVAEAVEHVFTTIIKRYKPTFMGVSQAACQWSHHFGLKNEDVAHNAIAVEEFSNIVFVDPLMLRKKYDISSDVYFLVYVGRLIPEKGVLQLAEATANLSKKYKIRLLLVGDGPLYDELSTKFGDEVQCIGSRERGEVLQLLHACDSFCLPSDSEGLPTVVLEAAMCNAHVIVTQYGGTKEIVQNEKFGICLRDNQVDTIEKGICEAIKNKQKCKEQANVLHEYVCKQFCWEKTVDAMLQHMTRSEK